MSEHNDTPPAGTEQAEQGSDAGRAPERGGNAEAAKYRRQLRDAEAERDGLRNRLDDYDRREVDRMAAERLADPSDLWLATSLEALRDDAGAIDLTKAEAEVDRVVAEHPHWRKATPVPPFPHQGEHGKALQELPSFGQAFKRTLGGG